jgi:hypothetical protein
MQENPLSDRFPNRTKTEYRDSANGTFKKVSFAQLVP